MTIAKNKKTPWKKVLVVIATSFVLVISLAIGLFSLYLYYQLPEVGELQTVKLNEPLKIYTRDNKLISEIGEIKRTPVTYDQLPQQVIYAFLAAEDRRFFEHIGIDMLSLGRAVWQYASDAKQQTGASTITMQLARNFYLTRARTLWRKYREILLALKIESELSKEQIITLYLNKIFLGNKAYGIAAAAKNYYSRPLDMLTLSQAATLAGLPKAPSRFNPVINPTRAQERRDWILGRMLDLGYINDQQQEIALAEDITPTPFWTHTDIDAQYVAEMVRLELLKGDLLTEGGVDESFLYSKGLRVYTTVDSNMQEAANKAVVFGLMEYEERHGYRKPERHFTLFDVNQDISDDTSDDVRHQVTEESIRKVLDAMSETSNFGGQLLPALVHRIESSTAYLWLVDGSEVVLDFKTNFPFKGLFVNVDSRRKVKPKDFSSFLRLGDMVRIRRNKDNSWVLAQVPIVQGALSSIDPIDGAIRAIVGGFYYYHSKYNRAVQAQRLLGSTVKPLIYSYAFSQGYKAGSIVLDAPLRFKQEDHWRPHNSDLGFLGPISLRTAIYRSRNVVSIRLLNELKLDDIITHLSQFNLSDEYPRDLSLALGTLSSTPLKVSQSFSIFANGGLLPSTYFIDRVEDHEGNVLYQATPQGICYQDNVTIDYPDTEEDNTDDREAASDSDLDNFYKKVSNNTESELVIGQPQPLFSKDRIQHYCNPDVQLPPRMIEEDVAYITNDILKGVARKGTARKIGRQFKRQDFGGKTGTTNNNIDTWFTGVHPLLVSSVWVGFDSPQSLGRIETGSRSALPIWIHYMKDIQNRIPQATLTRPKNVVKAYIDPITGDRVDKYYPKAIQEIFRRDNLPKESTKLIIKAKTGNSSEIFNRPEDIF